MSETEMVLRALEMDAYQHALNNPPFTDNGDGTCTIHVKLPYWIVKRRETNPEKGDSGEKGGA